VVRDGGRKKVMVRIYGMLMDGMGGHSGLGEVEFVPRSLHCAVRANGARPASVGMTGF